MLLSPLVLLLPLSAATRGMEIHESSAPAGVSAMKSWLEAHPEGVQGSFDLSPEGFRCLPMGCSQGAGWSLRGEGVTGYVSVLADLSGELSVDELQAGLSYVDLSYRVPLSGGWAARFNAYAPYRREGGGVLVESCQGRELSLRITQPTTQMSADRPEDRRCHGGSEESAPPSGCTAHLFGLQVPTSLRVRLTIPEEAGGRCPD